MKSLIFAVGTKNQIKIDAVGSAVRAFYPNAQIIGIDVPSGTETQPQTNIDTKKGAIKRAKNALRTSSNVDYGVGLESGVEFRNGDLWTFGWVAIIDRNSKLGLSKTIEFRLPAKMANLIKNGMEQGQADSLIFKRPDSGEKEGTVGLLTKGKVKRTEVFSQAVIFALVPFLNNKYYN